MADVQSMAVPNSDKALQLVSSVVQRSRKHTVLMLCFLLTVKLQNLAASYRHDGHK